MVHLLTPEYPHSFTPSARAATSSYRSVVAAVVAAPQLCPGALLAKGALQRFWYSCKKHGRKEHLLNQL